MKYLLCVGNYAQHLPAIKAATVQCKDQNFDVAGYAFFDADRSVDKFYQMNASLYDVFNIVENSQLPLGHAMILKGVESYYKDVVSQPISDKQETLITCLTGRITNLTGLTASKNPKDSKMVNTWISRGKFSTLSRATGEYNISWIERDEPNTIYVHHREGEHNHKMYLLNLKSKGIKFVSDDPKALETIRYMILQIDDLLMGNHRTVQELISRKVIKLTPDEYALSKKAWPNQRTRQKDND